MKKNPSKGSYHTKRSKREPNPHHHLPPMSNGVQDCKTKRTWTSKRITPNKSQIFISTRLYHGKSKGRTWEHFTKEKTNQLQQKVNKVFTHKSSNRGNSEWIFANILWKQKKQKPKRNDPVQDLFENRRRSLETHHLETKHLHISSFHNRRGSRKKNNRSWRRKGYLLKIANLPKQQSTRTEITWQIDGTEN